MTADRPLSRIRSLIYNHPWCIDDDTMNVVCQAYENAASQASGAVHEDFKAQSTAFPSGIDKSSRRKQISMVQGVAVIPVTGVLTHKASQFDKVSDLTSYETISRMMDEALSVDPVAIMFEHDSPGGNMVDLDETAGKIFKLRGDSEIPILSFVNPRSASASYYLASQADRVIMSPSGLAGNIGVLFRFAAEPVEITTIKSAELKTMDAAAMSLAQVEALGRPVAKLFARFKEVVERGRPGIDIARAATGESWLGEDAVEVGIADQVATFDQVIAEYGSPGFDDAAVLEFLYPEPAQTIPA